MVDLHVTFMNICLSKPSWKRRDFILLPSNPAWRKLPALDGCFVTESGQGDGWVVVVDDWWVMMNDGFMLLSHSTVWSHQPKFLRSRGLRPQDFSNLYLWVFNQNSLWNLLHASTPNRTGWSRSPFTCENLNDAPSSHTQAVSSAAGACHQIRIRVFFRSPSQRLAPGAADAAKTAAFLPQMSSVWMVSPLARGSCSGGRTSTIRIIHLA